MSTTGTNVRIYGDAVLRKTAEPVTAFDDELRDLIEEMIDTMFESNGVGLAGPQVGVSKRLFVIDASFGESVDEIIAMINPEILTTEGECSMEEGCLSVPGVWENVTRAEKVTVRFQDADGVSHEIEADEMLARVIQHEYDHLDGILFVDRLGTVKKKLLAKTLKQMSEEGSQV